MLPHSPTHRLAQLGDSHPHSGLQPMVVVLRQGPFCSAGVWSCDCGQMGWEKGVVVMQERRKERRKRIETKRDRGRR